MAKFIPTLGTDGWINEPEKVADYIMSCFLTANKSQSNILRSHSDTFQSLLAEFTNDIYGLEVRLQDVLTRKLLNAFDQGSHAVVKITALEDKPDQFTINFTGVIQSDGKEYTVGKLVKTEKSKIVQINGVNIDG